MKNFVIILFSAFGLINSGNFDYSGTVPSVPISCAPVETQITKFASVYTVRDGDWYTGSNWSNGQVPAETDVLMSETP